jgi:tRNA nucleotidyltransferase (CCA-adding enzyme)
MWYVSLMIETADNYIASLGVEAYRVGGSVRDEILERRVKDADYMVRGLDLRSLGDVMSEVDPKVQVTPLKLRDGRQAGWRAFKKGMGLVEVVLPRTEVSTGPGHGDFEIVVDHNLSLAEDAVRRDFTFNALYKIISHPDNLTVNAGYGDPAEGVLDPLGRGLFDLSRGLIQTTHPDSFRDDPLRTLRALRFVARGFTLSTQTHEQMTRHAKAVTGLSAKGYASGTVLEEMSKMLMGSNVANALRIARDTGVLGSLFPELVPMLGYEQGSRYHDMTTDEHTFTALATAAHVEAPLRVRWALLFHDSGKPECAWIGKDGRKHYYAAPVVRENAAGEFQMSEDHEVVGERIWRATANRIGAPRDLREDVATLIREHMLPLDGKFKASKVRQGRVKFGDGVLHDLYLHRACDISGKGKVDQQSMERLRAMEAARKEAQAAGVPSKAADLKINGHDAMKVGLRGPEIGKALTAILHEVASQPTERTLSREWQLGRLETMRDE